MLQSFPLLCQLYLSRDASESNLWKKNGICMGPFLKDAGNLRGVLKRATKVLLVLGKTSCSGMLKELNLFILCKRKMRSDLITAYK